MFDPHSEPRWMRRFSQFVLRQGFRRALLLCGALGALLALLAQRLLASGGAFVAPALWVVAALAGALAVLVVLRLVFQLDTARQQHNVLATQDATTGTANRRHFMLVAQREWARCRRYSEDGALLLVESDHARSLRESRGADCRDALLRDITRLITHALRQPDLLARHDKNQFIIFLPNTDPLGALDVAERIRERVAEHTLRWRDTRVNSTVSVGVASVGAAHLSLDALVATAPRRCRRRTRPGATAYAPRRSSRAPRPRRRAPCCAGARAEARGGNRSAQPQPPGVAGHLQVAEADPAAPRVEQFAQAFPVDGAGAGAAVEFLRVEQRAHRRSGRPVCAAATAPGSWRR